MLGTEIMQRVSASWMNWKRCRGVLWDKKISVKMGKRYTNGDQSSYVACDIDVGDKERTRSMARSERGENAEVDLWSDKEGLDPK